MVSTLYGRVNLDDIELGEIMNIYQKIIEVRKLVEFLQKDTQGYQYKYVSGSSLLSAIRPKMDEIGLLLITNIQDQKQDRYQWTGKDSKGNPTEIVQFVVSFTMMMTWVNAEEPEETITIKWFSSGEDEDPAKANGKAHTYGERYFGLKFFNIPTDNEDPDAHQKKLAKDIKKVETVVHKMTPAPEFKTITMKDLLIQEGIKKLGSSDKFHAWRVDNGLVENLDKATSAELTAVRIAITGVK